MAQHDMNIANQGFPAFRADLNSALTAIANNSSGATEPSTTFAYQWWYDTSTNALKMRNADNDAWIEIGTFNQTTDSFTPSGVTSDSITEGNSSVEVVDSGTGYVAVTVDGVETARFNAADGFTAAGNGQFNQSSGNPALLTFTSNGQAARYSRIKVDTDRSMIITAGVGTVNETPSIKLQTGTATGEKDRLVIDGATGNVGIGTSSPSTNLGVNGGGASLAGVVTHFELVDDSYATGTGTGIAFSSSGKNRHAAIRGESNSGTSAGNLKFYTRPSSGDLAERMRIDSSGNLLVGKAATGTNTVGFEAQSNGFVGITADNLRPVQINRKTSEGQIIEFRKDGSTVGNISVTGSATAYNTSSDYRLKEDWIPIANPLDRVLKLKPINFAWKIDGSRVDGFLAHEAQEVVPEAVHGTKDGMRTEEYEVSPAVYKDIIIPAEYDEEGNLIAEERTEQQLVTEAVMGTREVPDYQGIDQSKLVPLLTAALQEAITEIELLKARVNALENA